MRTRRLIPVNTINLDSGTMMLMMLATCLILSCEIPFGPDDIDDIDDVHEEAGLGFIPNTQGISLEVPGEELIDDSVFYVGWRPGEDIADRVEGEFEVVAAFTERPKFTGGGIDNSTSCFWMWHSGMDGNPGSLAYFQGCPVINGEIQYSEEPVSPLESIFPQSDTTVVYIVTWYLSDRGIFTHSSVIKEISAGQ